MIDQAFLPFPVINKEKKLFVIFDDDVYKTHAHNKIFYFQNTKLKLKQTIIIENLCYNNTML